MGLAVFDWMAESEYLSDDLIAHKIYALGEINEKARWASLGLQTASDIALSLIPGYGFYEASQSVEIIQSGRGGLMDYLTVGLAGVGTVTAAVKAFKYINKARNLARRSDQAKRFVGSYRSFTKKEFRHNLMVRTGRNPASDVHAHHVFPHELRRDFSAKGIEVNDPKYGAWWASGPHLDTHRIDQYNDRWKEFLTRDPSTGQLIEFGRRIAQEYGLDIGF
jgi:hypothetical protein